MFLVPHFAGGSGARYEERLDMDQVRGWLEDRGRMTGLSPGPWSSNSIAEPPGMLWHPLMSSCCAGCLEKTTGGL